MNWYTPEALGRSERMFRIHQERLPRELVLAGISEMAAANRYLNKVCMPAFNAEFMQPASEEGSAFVPWIGGELTDILCERYEHVVDHDNCASFEGLKLQNPGRSPSLLLCESKSHRAALFKRTNDHHARSTETCCIRFVWQGNKAEQNSYSVNPQRQLRNELNTQFYVFQSGQLICYKTGQFYLLLKYHNVKAVADKHTWRID